MNALHTYLVLSIPTALTLVWSSVSSSPDCCNASHDPPDYSGCLRFPPPPHSSTSRGFRVIFIKHTSDLVIPLLTTHQGSKCLQETVQIPSVIGNTSTSPHLSSRPSLWPSRAVHSPQMCLSPAFRVLLLPLPLSGTPCLPSAKSYLLPSPETPPLPGSPP